MWPECVTVSLTVSSGRLCQGLDLTSSPGSLLQPSGEPLLLLTTPSAGAKPSFNKVLATNQVIPPWFFRFPKRKINIYSYVYLYILI